MSKIRLIFAPENIGTAEKIADALSVAGYEAAQDREPASAAFVIWSAAAAASAEILAAARSALARRVLVPVAIGKAPPPSSFEHLWPVDIAGWDGSTSDPRWRFVLDEVELAVRRGVELPPADAPQPSAESLEEEFFADAPIVAGARAAPTPRVPRSAILGAVIAVGLVSGGVFLAVAAVKEAGGVADAPVIAFVEPNHPGAVDTHTDEVQEPVAPPAGAGSLRDAQDPAAEIVSSAQAGDVEIPVEDAIPAEGENPVDDRFAAETGAPAIAEDAADIPLSDDAPAAAFEAPRIKPHGQTRLAADFTDESPAGETPAPDEAMRRAGEHAGEHAGDQIGALARAVTEISPAAANAQTPEFAIASAPALAPNLTPAMTPNMTPGDATYGLYLRDCLDCPDLAEIDAGTLSPEPGSDLAVPLILRNPIAVSVYETTFADWSACVADGACPHISDNGWGGGDRPVVNVTYDDAQAYVGWLSRKTGRAYRLPTETEWEYAARAGSLGAFSFGSANVSGKANFAAANGRTLPVGRYAPNLFGLFDMHGNVSEWTADCWTGGEGASLVASFCSAHVVKGGGWDSGVQSARASARDGAPTTARRNNVGFRVVRDLR
ncbi:MAG: SUMF1/EgtB/PvdO family nonheme iron enzyme [Parvularculaceae bacterium]|nr:SUMF1/EgtB/PvdO family nonheme iron enzyme [Parvularculaceae bacterium]